VSTKKLVVSTYLQYILIALGALFLFVFVRQFSGVLPTFLFAVVLAYVLNPVVRRLEGWRVPRTIAVTGVFAALIAAVLVALLVLMVPAVGQVQSLVQNPEALTNGAAGLLDRVQELPYVGEQVGAVDQAALTRLVQSNAPSPGQVLNVTLGFIGGVFGVFGALLNLLLMLLISIYLLLDRERISAAALGTVPVPIRDQTVGLFHAVFAVPIVAIIAATLRYLRGTLLFERWRKPPIVEVVPEESPATDEKASVRGCVEGKR
jgi:predicted PurR-regulated permease PerM